MQVDIKADSDAMAERVENVVHYYLTVLDDDVDRIRVAASTVRDSLDTELFHCAVWARPIRGEELELEETQADLVLSVTRVLDRTVRTLRRRQTVRQLPRSA